MDEIAACLLYNKGMIKQMSSIIPIHKWPAHALGMPLLPDLAFMYIALIFAIYYSVKLVLSHPEIFLETREDRYIFAFLLVTTCFIVIGLTILMVLLHVVSFKYDWNLTKIDETRIYRDCCF